MVAVVKKESERATPEPLPENAPAVPVWSGFQKMNKPFADSLDHLQALEHEARVMLGLAWRRRSLAGFPAANLEKREEAARHFGHLEQMTLEQVEKYLADVRWCISRREELSRQSGVALSFLEFCASFGLEPFERDVVLLLFASSSSRQHRELIESAFLGNEEHGHGGMKVGLLLSILGRDFREQIELRRYFSMDSRLVRHEILFRPFNGYDEYSGILDETFWLHQRIADFLVGDDNTYAGALKFITREEGTVSLEQVVLPEGFKAEVLRHVENYTRQEARRRELGLEAFYGYGAGLTLFFHGASGTGKTMLAHALARHFGKGLLNVRVGTAGRHDVDLEDLIRYAFKEARLSGGIVFFDECDDLFIGNTADSRLLLTEIEKAACITILTTNRANRLDPALDRRISLKLHFPVPNEEQRAKIWRALVPPSVALGEDVDLVDLARTFVFTGGQIKNTLVMAINEALAADAAGAPVLGREAIARAAEYQANHIYLQAGLGAAEIPRGSIDDLALRLQDRRRLRNLARSVGRLWEAEMGGGLLFCSSDLATSTLAAEAVAADAGFRVRRFTVTDLCKTWWREIDPTTQEKIDPLQLAFLPFTGCRAVMLLTDAEGKIEAQLTGKGNDRSVAELLQRIEEAREIVFLVAPRFRKAGLPAGIHYALHLGLPPEEVQMRCWEELLHPVRCPEEALVTLAERHPMHFTQIADVVRQARIAALVNDGRENTILNHLEEAIYRQAQKPNRILFGTSRS